MANRLVIRGEKKLLITGCMTYILCRLGVLERVGSKERAKIAA
ncbi:MAG: hypothetical protein ACXADY_25140 [Candidatus Hodarchaeales archaeon]